MRKQLYKFYHNSIKRDEIFSSYKKLKETQFFSTEELDQLQFDYLQKLLVYSFEKTIYYNNLFNEIKFNPYKFDLDDFKSIPLLTKDIVRKHFNDIVANNHSRKFELSSTSGTTGRKFAFMIDKDAGNFRNGLMFRYYDCLKIDPFSKKVTIWGARRDVDKSKKFVKRIKSWVKNSVILSGYDLKLENVIKYLDFIQNNNVSLLISYPSILEFMASEMEKNNITFNCKNLKIQSAGEKLFTSQREKIERVFKVKVWDFYGARDIPFIAHECEYHNGLHIASENLLVETVNEEGKNIMEQEGELITTDLHNYVMPMIRYQIGDTGTLSSKKCNCNRSLPMLKEVSGRTFDIITFPNGNSVGGTFWPLLLKAKEGIEQFQVVQNKISEIEINYIPNEKFEHSLIEYYKNEIQEYSGKELIVNFKLVSEINKTDAGKFKYVISNL